MVAGGLMQLVAYGAQDIYSSHQTPTRNVHRVKLEIEKENKKKKHRNTNILKFMKFKNFKKTDNYDQKKCVICYSKFKQDDFVLVRKCKHIYHKDCDHAKIVNCPICRE